MLAAITSLDWKLAGLAAAALYAMWVANLALRECNKLRRELEAARQWLGEVDRRETFHSDDLHDRVQELERRANSP
jgi:hypothetical protein